MARLNRTTYAVLGFLTWGPMSGYDVKKAIEQSISNFWSESYGQIYPTLERLAEEGLAERLESSATGKRDRFLYTITDTGRAALRRWLADRPEPEPVRNELLLKMFFAHQVEPEVIRSHVETYRERMLATLERYEGIRHHIEEELAGHPDAVYWLMTLRYGRLHVEAAAAWCEEALEVLERLPERAETRDVATGTSADPARLRPSRAGGAKPKPRPR